MKTLDIPLNGYAVKTDIYEGSENGAVLLSLIGRTSKRTKQRYYDFLPRLASELGITSVIFDDTGHDDSPFDIEDISPAQHFLEVITVFDWIKENYPNRKVFVIGSSYGGFLATQLTKYREFDGLVLRASAIYKPSDFYTLKKNENREATKEFRRNAEAFAQASNGNVGQVEDFIKSLIKALAGLAGLVATGFFVVGGIRYMTASGNPEQLFQAKRLIKNALIGLMLVLSAAVLTGILHSAYNENTNANKNIAPDFTSLS